MDTNSTTHKRLNIVLASCVVLLCSVFTYFFFGFYLSDYEGLNIALLSGSLTPGMAFRSVYFSGNQVISHFYSLLYEYYPYVEWISWLEYFWMFIAAVLAMLALNRTFQTCRLSIGVKTVMMGVVYLLVFSDHQIHLMYVRVAYLVCGVSLISIIVFFEDRFAIKNKWAWLLLLNLFFAIGAFMRNEAAIACVLLVLPFALIYLRSIQHTALLFTFPLLLVGGQSLFFAFDIKNATDKEFYKQVEPDIEEQFIARGNLVPISSMKTYRDTVIYQMAAEMTFSDPKIMPSSFLRSLILPEKMMFTDMRQWNRVLSGLEEIFLKYWYLVLLVLLLSGAIFMQYDFRGQKFGWIYIGVFVLSFWGLTIAQTYVDKVNERSWIPYIGLFILCHILLLARSIKTYFPRKLYPIIVGCIVLALINLYYLKQESNRLQKELEVQQKQLQVITALAAKRILTVNSSAFSFLFLSNTPFHPFNFSAFNKLYITDSYIVPFLPYYKRYLESECKCDIYEYPGFWKYLKSINGDVLVVSEPYRLNTVSSYLSELHNFTLPVTETETLKKIRKDYPGNIDEFRVYQLDK